MFSASASVMPSAVYDIKPCTASVVMMFFAALLEVNIWAAVYLALGVLPALEPAVYFSTVTFTTLGYGDLTLQESWRLLGSFQAANGTIMFGWTTALVVAYMQRLAPTRSDHHRESKK